jgi:DnaJ-class molecular chaperone
MGKDYYKILEVSREATKPEICKAYKKKALVWHPGLSKENQSTSYHNFCEISEAYEVLSDDFKRAFYDKYGETVLKEGFFSDGELKGGYHFKGNPEEIFENFFGTHNVYSALLEKDTDNQGSMFGFSFGSQNFKEIRKPSDLVVEVPCTLVELFSGCSKKVNFDRITLNRDGVTTSSVHCQKTLEIRPGMQDGQEIKYEREGNEHVGMVASTLVFKLKQTPHQFYRRKGDDLIYSCHISLLAALCSEPLTVKTLDGRTLNIAMSEIISQDTVKKVDDEGMPRSEGHGRGDLYITFKINFPKQLDDHQRRTLRQVLGDSHKFN